MEQTNTTAPQGKGLAITGFILALIGMVGYFPVAGIVTIQAALGGGYGLGIFWLILCLLGTVMAVMGMMKLGKTGGKKGLGIAGLAIGAVATLLTIWLVIGIGKIQAASTELKDAFGPEFQKAMDEAKTNMEKMENNSDNSNNTDSTTAE